MDTTFEMRIEDIFRLEDDQIVLVGPVVGETKYIRPGRYELHLDDQLHAILRIEGEMAASHEAGPWRSVSTRDTKYLDQSAVRHGKWTLKTLSKKHLRGIEMHRHLVGIESPPCDFVPDPMTLGPALPENWDGDAWISSDDRNYFLRAWNKDSGRIAYGSGESYDNARRSLLDNITNGTARAVVSVKEE